MDTKSVIDKVNKLLALSKSANANEAAVAAAMANRLIDQYRLSQSDLTQEQEDALIEDSDYLYETGRIVRWKSSLAYILSKHYGCALFNSIHLVNGRKASRYKLIGRQSDVQIVRYMFNWLMLECQRLVKQEAYGKGKVFAQSYCAGFVAGVGNQLKASRQEVMQQADQNAITKINSREQEAIDLMHKLHKLKNAPSMRASQIDPNAFSAGMDRGKSFHLGKTVGNAAVKMLGN
jgi:hypothetical protein